MGRPAWSKSGTNFYLDSISTGTGPELRYGGSPAAAGQFGSWTPIGAEQTSSGYEVAWKLPGADQYSVWFTDSSGNETVSTGGILREQPDADIAGKQLPSGSERRRHHRTGVTTTTIKSYGSTSLVKAGTNFYLDSISSGSGPELQYGGAPVAAGQFGSWTLFGAEQTAGGYEVAWKVAGTDQYSIWFTDSSGNVTSYAHYSGTDPALEALETSFHQDLNHDGVIGIPAGQAPSVTSSAAVPYSAPVADNHSFAFRPDLGVGSNPQAATRSCPVNRRGVLAVTRWQWCRLPTTAISYRAISPITTTSPGPTLTWQTCIRVISLLGSACSRCQAGRARKSRNVSAAAVPNSYCVETLDEHRQRGALLFFVWRAERGVRSGWSEP